MSLSPFLKGVTDDYPQAICGACVLSVPKLKYPQQFVAGLSAKVVYAMTSGRDVLLVSLVHGPGWIGRIIFEPLALATCRDLEAEALMHLSGFAMAQSFSDSRDTGYGSYDTQPLEHALAAVRKLVAIGDTRTERTMVADLRIRARAFIAERRCDIERVAQALLCDKAIGRQRLKQILATNQ